MSDVVPVDLPVTSVRLFEDRAHVTRRGKVALPAGVAQLVVEDVAPVIADKTLAARAIEGELTITGARVERRILHTRAELGEDFEALARLRDEAHAALVAARSELSRASAEAADLANIEERLFVEIAQDVAYGRAAPERWREERARVGQLGVAAAERCAELDATIEARARELEDVDRRRAAMGHGESKRVARLVLTVHAPSAVEATVAVEYLVPGACWRPQHTAELVDGALRFRSDACVWQRTGEDYRGVELRFSTDRPSLGATPPRLASDVLTTRKREERMAVEVREEIVEDTGLGRAKVAPELPGIDDGGEPLELVAAAPATIPSDGRPYRVPIFAFEADAQVDHVLLGERAEAVILRSEQDHRGTLPILAGPVDLVRSGGFVGRTTVLFVAPGERFELGFGPEPALRVHRKVERFELPARMLSSQRRTAHRARLELSNLGPERFVVKVKERIPVSEVEKVKVALDAEASSPAAIRADADGFVVFPLTIAPHGRAEACVAHVVERHEDVVGME